MISQPIYGSDQLPALLLHQEVTLLALSDEKGTIETGSWYAYVAAGAVLAELMRNDRVRIQSKDEAKARGTLFNRKPKLLVTDPKPLGEELADEWLSTIRSSEKQRDVEHWLSAIANSKNLKEHIADGLVELGILQRVEDKVLWVFNRVRFPEVASAPETAIRQRLEAAIFEDSLDVEAGTVILLSLVKGGEFLPKLFDKKKLKNRKKHIDRLIKGEQLGAATAQLIESIQVMIIAVAAAGAAAAASS